MGDSLESGGPKHPHLSSKAENQAANLETVDPAQSRRQLGDRCSTGDKRRLMRPRAPAAYFETVGVKRWATWRQVWEKRGRQVQNHVAQGTQSQKQVGDKRGTNAESCGPKHPQTSGIHKRRIMRPRASTAYLETVGDKWETRETSLDSGGPDRLEPIWERSVGSCGPEHLQHTGR